MRCLIAQQLGRSCQRIGPIVLLIALIACSSGQIVTPTTAVMPATAVTATNPTPSLQPTTAPPSATPAATPATPTGASGPLTIFAASSLTDAFTDLQAGFARSHPNIAITFNFNASSNLKAQLEQGAKADLYAPADIPQMAGAQGKGIIQGTPQIFANNKLALIVPANNPAKIATPQDVANPGVHLILAAAYVPIGSYARLLFAKMAADPAYGQAFYQRALANIASEEANTRAVVNRIALGEGDAGVVYASDVTPAIAEQVRVIPIPETLQIIAQYPIALVNGAANAPAAEAFIAYLLSAEGQAILHQWGFLPVPPKSGNVPRLPLLKTTTAGFS